MRKHLLILAMLMIATCAFAVPFASQIKPAETLILKGSGTTINYFVNQAGGSATIEIIKQSDSSVVATFAGTAAKGVNSIVWDGTDNNAGGTEIGTGFYRVQITVDASATAGWVEIASNNSLGNYVPVGNPAIYNTLWDGFSPMEWLISQNPDEDSFGYMMVSTSYYDPHVHGFVVFNPDLSCNDGSDGSNTWLNYPTTLSGEEYTTVWGCCFDPEDPDYVWAVGQLDASVMYGKWNASTLTDVTNANTDVLYARDIAVTMQGSDKYAYVANASAPANVWKCLIESGVISSSTPPVNVLGLTDTNHYSKGVDFDSNGNLYFTSRYNDSSSGDGGVVYRWDKATIEAATAGSLTEANASWEVFLPGSNAEGIAITPSGDVYAAIANSDSTGNDGSFRGIYYVGNVATASNKKTLTVSDRVYAFYGTDYATAPSAYGLGIATDYAGNIYYDDRNDEVVRCVGPEGTTSVEVVAPLSQTLEIREGSLDAKTWAIYE